jgi:hypothetical protein
MHHATMTALVNERRATLLRDGARVRRVRRTRRGVRQDAVPAARHR